MVVLSGSEPPASALANGRVAGRGRNTDCQNRSAEACSPHPVAFTDTGIAMPDETTPLFAFHPSAEEERLSQQEQHGGRMKGRTRVAYCSGTQLLAFVAALLMAVGTHYANHSVSPLKGPLTKSLGISNAAFGVLLSSLSLTKTVVPLASGFIVSRFGIMSSSLVVCAVTVIGEAMLASASETGGFLGMVTGICVYSLGSSLVPILQEVIVVDRFQGKYLSTVIGLLLAVSKAVDFLASGAVLMIVEAAGGSVATAFWAATAVCALSCIAVAAYAIATRRSRVDSPTRAHHLPLSAGSRGHRTRPDVDTAATARQPAMRMRAILHFPDAFWLFLLISFLFGSIWHPYIHILSNLITVRYSVSDVQGAWQASYIYIMPALLNPLAGLGFDRFGMRCYALIAAAILVHLSLAFVLIPAASSPVLPLVFLSLALACGPLALKTIAAMLFSGNPTHTAIALGLHACADHMGGALMDPIAGLVQDVSKANETAVVGTTMLRASGYTNVLLMLLFLSTLTVALSVVLVMADGRSPALSGVLNASKDERDEITEKRAAAALTDVSNAAVPVRRWVYLCVGVGLVVMTWLQFFVTTVWSTLAERRRQKH